MHTERTIARFATSQEVIIQFLFQVVALQTNEKTHLSCDNNPNAPKFQDVLSGNLTKTMITHCRKSVQSKTERKGAKCYQWKL